MKLTEREQSVLSTIEAWAGIDGGHHKQWLIDQVVQILTGDKYEEWIAQWEAGDDGPQTYIWDKGIAP